MLKATCSGKNIMNTGFYSCISDIIEHPQLLKLTKITHHISTTRFQHCLNVSYYSYIVCRKLGLDARSAARAGLLHDLFFYDRKKYNLKKRKNQPSHSLMHSMIALKNASELTEINPVERDIISKHMWPVTRALPKYRETYIITIIDKFCAVIEFFCGKKQHRILKSGVELK